MAVSLRSSLAKEGLCFPSKCWAQHNVQGPCVTRDAFGYRRPMAVTDAQRQDRQVRQWRYQGKSEARHRILAACAFSILLNRAPQVNKYSAALPACLPPLRIRNAIGISHEIIAPQPCLLDGVASVVCCDPAKESVADTPRPNRCGLRSRRRERFARALGGPLSGGTVGAAVPR